MNTLLRYTLLVFAAGYPTALFLQSTGTRLPEGETVIALYVTFSFLLIAISDYSRRSSTRTLRVATVLHPWRPALRMRAGRAATTLASASRCAP
jgi:hypothetical protein